MTVSRGGRPTHQTDEQKRLQVETMASYGIPEVEIARVLRISAPTLRKYYSYELGTGHIKANAMVAQSLFQKATGTGQGSVAAAIFWLKCRAGWRELPQADEYVGKKELVLRDAATAGGADTDWAGDLDFDVRPN